MWPVGKDLMRGSQHCDWLCLLDLQWASGKLFEGQIQVFPDGYLDDHIIDKLVRLFNFNILILQGGNVTVGNNGENMLKQ